MKKIRIVLLLIGVLSIIYVLGPSPESPVYTSAIPEINVDLNQLDEYIQLREAQENLRENNEARIIWANDTPSVTDYVFFYLHGFSASWKEGDPVHKEIAQTFESNLYLCRLEAHGLKDNQLISFTAETVWKSALQEFAIAEKLGKKVIIISTSTGGTLALKIASDFPERVHALVNLSPNIKIKNPAAMILNDPWGLQIARLVYGGDKMRIVHKEEEVSSYWDTLYPAEATVQLQELLETTMFQATYQNVHCPVLNIYYYKDKGHQDEVVEVAGIPDMHKGLGTEEGKKRLIKLTTPGDHVIASSIKSKDYKGVENEIQKFCLEVLKMPTNK